jgi:type VI secretion system protein ImpD/type VI secretion system protein ImpC
VALRDLVLGGGLALPAARDSLAAWAAWHAAPPRERGPAAALAARLEHPAVAALHAWLSLDAPRDILAAWFGEIPADAARAIEAMDRDIAAIDRLVSAQLDAVLHAPRLQRLEGSWRGLDWLSRSLPAERSLRIRLLAVSWREVVRDLERAPEFDQSQLFRKIYEDEFGTPGGEPFGLLVLDHALRPAPAPGHPTDDIAALRLLAGVAAASFAPLLLAADPSLFGLDAYAEARPDLDLAAALRDRLRERPGFASLRAQEEARFLGLVLPRALARTPYADDGTRADGFRYREHAPDAAARVWMSAAYPFAAIAARAFARYRWPAEIRGAEPGVEALGGVVEGLPAERLRSDPRGPAPRPPLELVLTDEQERQLADSQIVPLCGLDGLPEAAFGAVPSLHRPPRMSAEIAEANQRLSAQLNNVLCVSRFAHCVKLMGRDMVGSALSAPEVELRLSRWLQKHVSGLVGGGDAAARYPLADARVEVRERPGKPGSLACTIHLQPHHQLDDVGAAFRLVTDLSAPRVAA